MTRLHKIHVNHSFIPCFDFSTIDAGKFMFYQAITGDEVYEDLGNKPLSYHDCWEKNHWNFIINSGKFIDDMQINTPYQAVMRTTNVDLKVYHDQKLKRRFTKIHTVISHAKAAPHLSGYIRPKKHEHL